MLEERYEKLLQKSVDSKSLISFQTLFTVFNMCMFASNSFIMLHFAALLMFPTYTCSDDGQFYQECTRELICGGKDTPQMHYHVEYNSPTNLHNWVEQMDLICVPDSKIGMMGSMIFIGFVSTSLIIPPLADRYGRRIFLLACHLVTIITTIALYQTKSANMAMFIIFVMGAMIPGRWSAGYVYFTEFVTKDKRLMMPMVILMLESAFTSTAIAFFYMFIGNDWRYLTAISFVY